MVQIGIFNEASYKNNMTINETERFVEKMFAGRGAEGIVDMADDE